MNPQRCGGDPCVAGRRIMVWLIFEALAEALTIEEVAKLWSPPIPTAAISEALTLAKQLFQRPIYPEDIDAHADNETPIGHAGKDHS